MINTTMRMTLSLIQLSFSIVYAYYWYVLRVWYKPTYSSKKPPTPVINEDKVTVEGKPSIWSRITGIFSSGEEEKDEPEQTFYNNG